MKLTTKIKKVLYPKDSDELICWRIISTENVIVKGVCPEYKENATVTFVGDFVSYNGERQFSFTGSQMAIATNLKEKLYLACDITKGIGDKLREKIWDKLGEDWQGITEQDGILNAKKIEALQEAIEILDDNENKTKVVSYLLGKGITKLVAEKAFEKWNIEATALIDNNPYILTTVSRVGFIEVDTRIRHQFGIEDTAPQRIDSCINYTINKMTSGGDSVIGWQEFAIEVFKLLNIDNTLIVKRVEEMINNNELYYFTDCNLITTAKNFKEESAIYKFLTGE